MSIGQRMSRIGRYFATKDSALIRVVETPIMERQIKEKNKYEDNNHMHTYVPGTDLGSGSRGENRHGKGELS